MIKTAKTNNSRIINIAILVTMASAILAAIKPWNAWKNTNYNVHGWNLFSYFTVDSNLLTILVLLLAAYALTRRKPLTSWFSQLRGATVLYMVITGIVYSILLENNGDANESLSFDWKNFVLHKLAPLFIIVWWLLWPSKVATSVRQSLYWLVFPLAWLIYTLIRGATIHWYPYPFLDPAKAGGASGVALHVFGIFIGFVALSQLIAWISRVRARNESIY